MTFSEQIAECRELANQLTEANPLLKQLSFEIRDIPYDEFIVLREGREILTASDHVWTIIYGTNGAAGNCLIILRSAKGHVKTAVSFESLSKQEETILETA